MNNTRYIQKARFLKKLRLNFEGSMNDNQKKAFFIDCVRLSNQILEEWSPSTQNTENDALTALDILAPCMTQESMSPMFQALVFRRKARNITSVHTQIITPEERVERVDELNKEQQMLCEGLIEHSTLETEEKTLEAIEIIEETMDEIRKVPITKKIQQIEPPKYYRYK